MQHARRRSDAPPEPDLDQLAAEAEATRRRAEEYLTRVGELLDAAEAGRPLPDGFGGLWHALRQLGASQAMLGEQFKRLSLEQVFADMDRAAMEGAGHAAGFTAGVAAARGRHRHRRGRAPGGGQLSVLPGGKTWKGAAVSTPAALKAAGLLTATAASIVIAVPALPSLPSSPAHHAQAFGGLSPVAAFPAVTPSPVRAYKPRHARRPSAFADAATLAPPPPVAAPRSAAGAVSGALSGPVRGPRRAGGHGGHRAQGGRRDRPGSRRRPGVVVGLLLVA